METQKLVDIVGRFPTTAAQQRFWFQELTSPGDIELNIAVRWEIRGKFSASDIEKAVQIVVARHEMLRTRFVETDGELWQEVVDNVGFRLGVVDLRAVAPDEHEARVAAMSRELAGRPFDLTQPCLLRMSLAQLAPDRAEILIAAHHIAFDGFSIGVLGQEIGQIVQAFAEDRKPDLPDLPLQYGDFALWEKELEASGALEADGVFWDEKLKNARYFELETDFPRPAKRTTTGKTLVTPFPADFDRRMTEFNKSAGISYFTLGAAALGAALHVSTGKTDILFAAPVAGRTDIETEKLIGVFINTLAIRMPAQSDSTLMDHIFRVQDVVKDSLLHQAYPFNSIVQRLRWPRDTSRTPLASLNLNMQRVFLEERKYGAFEMVSVPSHMPGVFYDMNIQIIGRNSGWKLMIDYNDSLFRAETVAQFSDLLLLTFEQILSDPSQKISSLPFERGATPPAPVTLDAAPEPRSQKSVPLHNEIEGVLQQIWADILGIAVPDARGDFFELGGHSLVALRMLARVQERFGYRVPLGVFLSDPSLKAVAQTIADGLNTSAQQAEPAPARPAIWDVLTLRPAHDESPLIVTMNQPFLYHAMANHIADGLEFINLYIPDAESVTALEVMEFDALAQTAVQVLQARYPGRQMVLMGHCVDGLMALRMAQYLSQDSETVLAVAMIDAWHPDRFARMTRSDRFRARWVNRGRRWSHNIVQKLEGQISWKELLLRTRPGIWYLRRIGAAEQESDASRSQIAVNHHLVVASRRAEFAPYNGDVVLFRTRAHSDAALAQMFGWTGVLAADTPVYSLPGWHEDALLTTGIDRISKVLEAKINRHSRVQAARAGKNAR